MTIRKSLESSFSLTVAMYFAFIITFFYSIILVRLVSVEAFGMIGMGNTYMEIAMMLATLGSMSILQTYTTYYMSRRELGILKHLLIRYSSIIMAIGSVFTAITFIFSKDISIILYKTDIMDLPLKAVSVLLLANLSLRILYTIIKAAKQFRLYSGVEIASAVLNLAFTVIFILYITANISKNDDVVVVASFAASIAMALVCCLVILIKNRKNIGILARIKSRKPRSKRMLRFGVTSASLIIISMWSIQINRMAVGYFLEPDQWGYFYIAVIIVNIILVFKTVLNVIAYPSLVDAHSRRDYKEFGLTIHIVLKYWTLFVIPLVLVFTLFLPYVIPVIWGVEYSAAALTAQIMLIGFSIQNYSSIYSSALTAIEKPHKQFGPTLVYVSLNIVLSLVLVYYFGILGAAMTILLTNIVNIMMSRHIFNRDRRLRKAGVNDRYMKGIVKLLSVELAIICLLFLPAFYVMGMVTGIYVQFFVAFLFGALLSFMSMSYIFGRRKMEDEEAERLFSMFPKYLETALRLFQRISLGVWRG